MNQVIGNPIGNSPFDEPTRHFQFTHEGVTNEIVDGRNTGSYFAEVAKKFSPKRIDDVHRVWTLRG
jgi:type III restriction enzyme